MTNEQLAALVADNERMRAALDQIADGEGNVQVIASQALAAPPPAVVAEWAAAKALAEAYRQFIDSRLPHGDMTHVDALVKACTAYLNLFAAKEAAK